MYLTTVRIISNFGQHDNKKLKTSAIITSFIMYLMVYIHMYKTNVSVCPQTIFNVKSVGENTM